MFCAVVQTLTLTHELPTSARPSVACTYAWPFLRPCSVNAEFTAVMQLQLLTFTVILSVVIYIYHGVEKNICVNSTITTISNISIIAGGKSSNVHCNITMCGCCNVTHGWCCCRIGHRNFFRKQLLLRIFHVMLFTLCCTGNVVRVLPYRVMLYTNGMYTISVLMYLKVCRFLLCPVLYWQAN